MRPPTARRLRASSSAERSARSSPRVSPTWSGRRARRSRCRPSWRSSRETRSCSTGSPSARPAGPGCRNAEIQRLFAPRPATVAAVRSYLSANGLSVVDSTDMSLVVSGTAAAADQAFGVGLRTYTDARGITYQAPSRNVRLPKGIASVVQSVAGLDSSLKLHPHYQVAKHVRPMAAAAKIGVVPNSVAGCTAALHKQTQRRRGLPATGPRSPDRLQPRRAGQRRERRHGAADRVRRVLELQPGRRDPLQELLHGHHGRPRGRRDHRRRPERSLRPGRGQPRHRGRNGRGAGCRPEGLQGREQPGAAADDAPPDAHRRRRRRLGQLGPLRALRSGQADRGREHGARAARGEQRLVLRRLG